MVKPGSGCASSAMPCGGTVPQEWKFGSISGDSAGGASTAGSSSTRSSRRNEKSGRKPVVTTMRSTESANGAPASRADNAQAVPSRSIRSAAKGASILQAAIVHGMLCGETEGPAFGQLVVEAAAEQLVDAVAAQGPEDLGRRCFILQLHQRQRDIDGGMAGADHQDAPAGIVAAQSRRRRPECHRRCDPTPGLHREPPRPSMPIGLGCVQVPDASITARASTRCSPSLSA